MTDQLVIAALQQAIRERNPGPGLIHHSDRGGQYASTRYRAMIRRATMKQSMSRAADCYDNAFMEYLKDPHTCPRMPLPHRAAVIALTT